MLSLLRASGRRWLRQNLPRVPLLVNLAWGLFRDPRVPASLKAGLLGALIYVASPLDILPDFIPVLGMVDDLFVLLVALDLFIRLAPPEVVAEVEERYRLGHTPLRTDLQKARKHFGRLWSWAIRKIQRSVGDATRRIDDRALLRDLKRKGWMK